MDEVTTKKLGINNRIKRLNSSIESLTMQNNKIYFLSINTLLLDTRNNLSEQYHAGDGIHLNAAGYGLWINALQEQLNLLNNSLHN